MSRPLLLLAVCLLPALVVVDVVPVGAHDGHEGRPHAPGAGVWFQEVVTDPQTDRTGEGAVTSSDEYVVLVNDGPDAVDLDGWTVQMNDSTPEEASLTGVLAAGATFVLHNPAGQMNNDVALVLRDAAGTARDQVQLGAGGVPDGNADDPRDEAVHLVGPWAAAQGPGTNGTGLGAFWVEWVARATTTPTGPFGDAWLSDGEARLDVRLHAAPNSTIDNVTVAVDGEAHNASEVASGLWRTDVFTAPVGPGASVTVTTDTDAVHAYPGRGDLLVRIDATAPLIADEALVANATRHVRWLPLPVDPESGVAHWNVSAFNSTHEWNLTGCQPHHDPSPVCRLPSDNVTVRVAAENGAGASASRDLAVVNDTAPPSPPAANAFQTGTPPTWTWSAFDEPLKALDVEVADDVTGVWWRGMYPLEPDATVFVDEDWVPGDPRAYRLVARDRADHVTSTDWVALPPAAVPVQWAFDPDEDPNERAATLASAGAASITITFDRPLDVAPDLVLDAQDPRPARITATGSLDPSADIARYTMEAAASFPASGSGTWSLSGGRGADDAPMAAAPVAVTWDSEPPRLDAVGSSDRWIRAVRHVVTLQAVDALDPSAVVDLDRTGKGILVRRDGDGRRLTFTAEGTHQVTGVVRDAAGNERSFSLHVALDGTVPTALLDAPVPVDWSADAPILLRVSDAASGVNRSSLQAWVQGNITHGVAVVAAWDGDVARLVPDGVTTLAGPLRVHVAVADAAGNLAEGLVSEDVAPRRHAGQAAGPVVVGDAGNTSAPTPSGPGWLVPGTPSAAPGTADGSGAAGTGGEASRTGVAEAAAAHRDEPTTGAKTLDWVVLAIIGAGGSIGLGTVVRRGRGGATARRSPSARPDGTRTPPRRPSPSPTGRCPTPTGRR